MSDKENILNTTRNILLCDNSSKHIVKHFCGTIVTEFSDNYPSDILVYAIGDISKITEIVKNNKILVIRELSHNFENVGSNVTVITYGEVPLNINNVGVFFSNFFDNNKNYFKLLNEEHKFQDLTESNKPGSSYRNGIYLTKVEESEDEIKFNLLRCSTNLNGPTDNFRNIDNEIVDKVNGVSKYFYEEKVELNHVLAQVYNNVSVGNSEKKAKIKEHSDKTKDMPRNALMAFCTFYEDNGVLNDKNKVEYDYCYKKVSLLTKLRFRLKNVDKHPDLVKNFDITLYPNSVFIMSLYTNRLYTHEIAPSILQIDKIPTRLGYVIRMSNMNAVFKNNQTYIKEDNKLIKLEKITDEDAAELKKIYYLENATDDLIHYGDVRYSMNEGDYKKPIV